MVVGSETVLVVNSVMTLARVSSRIVGLLWSVVGHQPFVTAVWLATNRCHRGGTTMTYDDVRPSLHEGVM